MDGIIIVDKPADWTSQDVTAKLRGVFQTRRIGHGGTLDPMATGLLVVFVGRATRAVEFAEGHDKAYRAGLRLGLVTDTQDITGTVLEEKTYSVSDDELKDTLEGFKGDQLQLPPMYSAIKVGGKKLYELARKGQEVERKPREITVFELKLQSFEGNQAEIYVHCSKGTYVRTLCHDIGAALGCGGCMAALRRVQAGEYTQEQSYTMEEILSCEAPEKLLLPVESLFLKFAPMTLTPPQEKCVRNGAAFTCTGKEGCYRLYAQSGEFLALGEIREGKLSTVKSFFEI